MAQVVSRTEFSPYQLRKDADQRVHSDTTSHILFNPAATESSFGQITREQRLEVPQSWVDASIYLHIEAVGSAYSISINGRRAIECEDSLTPTDYDISPYLRVGENLISITTRSSALAELEQNVEQPQRTRLEGSYIYIQNRLRILDYRCEVIAVDGNEHGQLLLDVVVQNSFNYPETLEIGFDIYDPTGKLLDFSTAQAEIEGGQIDTIRFSPYLYGATKFKWSATGGSSSEQPLYSVMIFTRRNRVATNYIPFHVGFFTPHYTGTTIEVDGTPIAIKSISYNALADEKSSEKELRSIKQKGFNTIIPDYPQPIWFYTLCDKIGLYVIDQAAINAPNAAGDKRVGGTPSNDPTLLGEYLARVQKAYLRTHNFNCVIAYSLGGESGNGYNMYKAYQWLKEVEKRRPIIYRGAQGEWNSDPLKID